MTLDDFVSKGWSDHGDDAEGVFARLPEGFALVTELRHLPALAGLIVHVSGEHLGRWHDGVALLERLELLPCFDPQSSVAKQIARSKAVLHRCAGNRAEEERCTAAGLSGGGVPEASDRIRILAIASAALVGQKRMAEARADFDAAVALASYGPGKDDPAARALAITAHSIASEFETRPTLTDDERAMMLRCAAVSRDFWLIAGGWMEHERAEYRLAKSHLKAGDAQTALLHAQECRRIVADNGSDPGEEFFAGEAVTRALLATGDASGARRERNAMAALVPAVEDESFRQFCAEELAKLDAALAAD